MGSKKKNPAGRPAARKDQPLLSIAMIFKNEIRCLERCLKSLAPLRAAIPCQLVMADTGATDGSRAVAEQYADVLFDFPWINDFSAARNAVLDRCTGQWYLAIDCDEWLEDEPGPLARFFTTCAAELDRVWVVQRNYRNDLDSADYGDHNVFRMFRISTGLRYRGSIHEVPRRAVDESKLRSRILTDIILHHDGYTATGRGQGSASKGARNLPLLDKELEKLPADDREYVWRCVQCAQSAAAMGQLSRMMDYVRKGLASEADAGEWRAVLYQQGAKCGELMAMPEAAKEMLEEGRRVCPGSFFVEVDAAAHTGLAYYAADQKAEALPYLQGWRTGLAQYQAQPPEDRAVQKSFGGIDFSGKPAAARLLMELTDCLAEQGLWDEAGDALAELEFAHLALAYWDGLLQIMFTHLRGLPNGAEQLRRLWETTDRLANEGKLTWEIRKQKLMKQFVMLFDSSVEDGNETAAQNRHACQQAVAELGENTVGLSARVILAETPEEAEGYFEKITDWCNVLPAAVSRMMELGVPLPARFYAQGAEALEDLAGALPEATLLDAVLGAAQDAGTVALSWRLNVTVAALRRLKWRETARYGKLVQQFADLTAVYLNRVHNLETVAAEPEILRGVHHFGWLYLQARQTLEAGDQVGYLRLLRQGLSVAPSMKDTVDFLTDALEQEAARPAPAVNPELEALARKVKAMLDGMDPNDPAVQELKASPAYQKVAPIMDSL